MNQKNFVNIILVIIAVVLVGAIGYFALVKKSASVKLTDKTSLYSVEIPKDWKITSNEGIKGVSLSSAHIESPDWKSHLVVGGPHDDIYYETGAYLNIGVDTLKEDLVGTEINKKSIIIDGVSGFYYVFTEPSLKEGRLLGSYVYYKGNRYTFRFGYNPNTYPQGEMVFTNILNSFKFTK